MYKDIAKYGKSALKQRGKSSRDGKSVTFKSHGNRYEYRRSFHQGAGEGLFDAQTGEQIWPNPVNGQKNF